MYLCLQLFISINIKHIPETLWTNHETNKRLKSEKLNFKNLFFFFNEFYLHGYGKSRISKIHFRFDLGNVFKKMTLTRLCRDTLQL